MLTADKTTQTLMAIIATILVVWALKATQPVSMPLAFAFFISVLVYPLQRRFNRYMPRWLSLALVLLLLLAIVGVAIGALVLSAGIIEPKVPEYANQLQSMLESARSWAEARSIPVPQFSSPGSNVNQFTQEAIGGIRNLLTTLSLSVLIISMLTLLLLEVGQYKEKARQAFPSRSGARLIDAVDSMSDKLRRYLLVMTFTSVLTGILTIAWCFILGVDLAFVWGLVAFILNYVPTLGSIIAVIPPTLVALIFNGVGRGIATLVGLAAIQLAMGNFVDPRLQGKTLQLSPFVALVSIVFWGWVWGIPGAILGVPMTIAIILFCQEFEPTRGVAIVLGEANHT